MSLTPQFSPPSEDGSTPAHVWLRGKRWSDWAKQQPVPIAPEGAKPEMVWTDFESTGLDPWTEVPLEAGILLTDKYGRLIPDGAAQWLIFSNNFLWSRALGRMTDFVRDMHTKSGLLHELAGIQKRPEIQCSVEDVDKGMVEWLAHRFGGKTFAGKERFPACGSSVSFDRNMMCAHMPRLFEWFNYRIGDVSAVRTFASLHFPAIEEEEPQKREIHRVLPDMVDSVELYRFYMHNFFTGAVEEL